MCISLWTKKKENIIPTAINGRIPFFSTLFWLWCAHNRLNNVLKSHKISLHDIVNILSDERLRNIVKRKGDAHVCVLWVHNVAWNRNCSMSRQQMTIFYNIFNDHRHNYIRLVFNIYMFFFLRNCWILISSSLCFFIKRCDQKI